ncbi:MAG: carbohydrate kinase family protein [Alphaproteobacteria bacterium]
MTKKALCFGSAMIDIITILNSDNIEQLAFRNAHSKYLLVEQGQKLEAKTITIHVGGGALNAACALSRLGFNSTPFVLVGDDVDRIRVKEHVNAFDLNNDHIIKIEGQPTGSAVMISSHDRNAAIFTRRGANTGLRRKHLNRLDAITDHYFDLIHIAPLSGDSAKLLPELLAAATRLSDFISCNPGIKQLQTYGDSLLENAQSIKLLSLNLDEATAFAPQLSSFCDQLPIASKRTDSKHIPMLKSEIGNIPLTWFMQQLHGLGIQNILVTDGSNGAFLYDGKLHHQPIIKTQVAGTAGAGDAFVSTLLGLLVKGYDSQNALYGAATNASAVVAHADTSSGLMAFDALKQSCDL